MKIKIVTESTEAFAELNNTKTAYSVAGALPFESIAHRWGEEIYFDIPLELELEMAKKCLILEILPTGCLAKACASSLAPLLQARAARSGHTA